MYAIELNPKDTYFVPSLSLPEDSQWASWSSHPSHKLPNAISTTMTSEPSTLGPSLTTCGLGLFYLTPLCVTLLSVLHFTFFLLHLPVGHCQRGICETQAPLGHLIHGYHRKRSKP